MYDVCAGIRVVELASWIFMPTAGAILADWGAEVIKIEDPRTGDSARGLHNAVSHGPGPNLMVEIQNRGKRSIGLDIRSDEGYAVLNGLIAKADVVITSYLPETRRKLRVDTDDILAINPNVVFVRGTGQGRQGPDAEKGGFDMASAWARGGLAYMMMTDRNEAPPFQPGPIGDLTGGLAASAAIAAALLRRERTGRGAIVDVALSHVGMWLMGYWVSGAAVGKPIPRPSHDAPNNPLVNFYRTKDDRWICLVMLQSERVWPDLCERLGRPELVNDPRFVSTSARLANLTAAIAELDAAFATRTFAEWREVLDTAQGVWSPVLNLDEVAADRQTIANGFLSQIEDSTGGEFPVVGSPSQFDELPLTGLKRAPEHGENTEEVLLEQGYDWGAIVGLKERGVIM